MPALLMRLSAVILFLAALLSAGFAAGSQAYLFDVCRPFNVQKHYFADSEAVAVDGEGNVFVLAGEFVMKFDSSGNYLSHWGGLGSADGEFDNPQSLALGKDGYVYVADTDNDRIQKFTNNGAHAATWPCLLPSGQSYEPFAVAVGQDAAYVTNLQNNIVQKLSLDGEPLLGWGGWGRDPGLFRQPVGVLVGVQGGVFVSDLHNQRVHKFTADGVFLDSWGGSGEEGGQFGQPYGMALDQAGNVLVADREHGRLQRFTSSGQYLETIDTDPATGQTLFNRPESVAMDAEGNLYVLSLGSPYYVVSSSGLDQVSKVSPDGELLATWRSFGADEGMLNRPEGLALAANGTLYVLDTFNDRVLALSENGTVQAAWGSRGEADGQFRAASDLALDPAGNVWVADYLNGRIQKFTAGGEHLLSVDTPVFDEEEDPTPTGVAADAEGNIYVSDYNSDRMMKYSSEGELLLTWGEGTPEEGGLDHPWGVAVDDNGTVYVVNNWREGVQAYSSNGTYLFRWGEEGTGDEQFESPIGIALDGQGQVYISDVDAHSIKIFTTAGEYLASVANLGVEPGQVRSPYAVVLSANGTQLYVADTYNDRIQSYVLAEPGEMPDKAIVVAGSGPYTGNSLWDATQMNTHRAVSILKFQGYAKEHIRYLHFDTSLDLDQNGLADDVYAEPSRSSLQEAITSWAADANSLLIYMVGHGGDRSYREMRISQTEIINAADMASWLGQIPLPGGKIIIYDGCESGSFLQDLSDPDTVLLTSSAGDEAAYFANGGVLSFSYPFWAEVMYGAEISDAFALAAEMVALAGNAGEGGALQNPQLEADGDGVGSQKEDYAAVAGRFIGKGTQLAADQPYIVSVSPAQAVSAGGSAALWAADIVTTSTVQRVWAVITPPGFSPDTATPITDVAEVELVWNSASARYEGVYAGFDAEGDYRVAVMAMDQRGNVSLPRSTSITVEGAGSDITGWWWEEGAAGWAVSMEDLGDAIFLAWYAYKDGAPWWYAATLSQGSGGAWTGDLLEYRGWQLGVDAPSQATATAVGTLSLTFDDTGYCLFSYTIGQESGAEALTRWMPENYPGAADPQGVSGWWQDPARPDMALFFESHGDALYGGWFHYGPGGAPRWWSLGGEAGGFPATASSWSGQVLQWEGGQEFGGAWSRPASTSQGQASVEFAGNGTAIFTWEGMTFDLQRMVF